MKEKKVQSSHIRGIAYLGQSLMVHFNDGSWYAYLNVPRETYQAFLKAESKGKFLAEHIKPSFRYERL
ncbi:MAG: KTSC domain-containing protein [Anaerolineales bacterium]|nr:KTSC domain-containing protein [Anaerolineales bacterium]